MRSEFVCVQYSLYRNNHNNSIVMSSCQIEPCLQSALVSLVPVIFQYAKRQSCTQRAGFGSCLFGLSKATAGNDWDSTRQRYNPATGGKVWTKVEAGANVHGNRRITQPGVNVTSKNLTLLNGITRLTWTTALIGELFRFATGSDSDVWLLCILSFL